MRHSIRKVQQQTLIPRDRLLATLRADAPGVVLGILILAVGLGAFILYRLRARSKEPTLLWFGLFALLYGVRVLLDTPVVRFTLQLADTLDAYVIAAITYSIPIPALMFIREAFPAQKDRLKWVIRFQIAFAVVGIALDLALRRPLALQQVNNVLALGYTVVFVSLLFVGKPGANTAALRIGLLTFSLTIVLSNLASLGILPLAFNWEPVGFVVLLAALGKVIAQRLIDNEERLVSIEKELEIARRIQLSILPREMPGDKRLRIAARYLPMTAVAGDFYEFLTPTPNQLGILVADVSGHGVPAALIASMVKVAIAAQLPHADDPARVIAGMNQTLCGKLQGQFVTAAYLFLDLDSFTLRYAAAGHPPLLWQHSKSGEIEPVEENGMVLGFFAHARYTTVEHALAAGDRFLLYTDGLLEATNGTEEFYGPARLQTSLAETPPGDADHAVSEVLERLSAWSGRVGTLQEDDLTAVYVEVAGTDVPASD